MPWSLNILYSFKVCGLDSHFTSLISIFLLLFILQTGNIISVFVSAGLALALLKLFYVCRHCSSALLFIIFLNVRAIRSFAQCSNSLFICSLTGTIILVQYSLPQEVAVAFQTRTRALRARRPPPRLSGRNKGLIGHV